MQVEFYQAMQAIHVPCEELKRKAVADLNELHSQEVAALRAELDEIKEKTSTIPRWRLVTEPRNEHGGYASGCPMYFCEDGKTGIWDDTNQQSFVLEFERKGQAGPYWEEVAFDCGDTHGFVEQTDGTMVRVICRSGKILKQFTTWAEKSGVQMQDGMWGFVAALSQ